MASGPYIEILEKNVLQRFAPYLARAQANMRPITVMSHKQMEKVLGPNWFVDIMKYCVYSFPEMLPTVGDKHFMIMGVDIVPECGYCGRLLHKNKSKKTCDGCGAKL